MSKNFGEIKTAIGDWLNIESATRLPLSVRGDLINWTIREYCRKRESRFGEESDNFATVVNTRDYAQPTRFSKPKKMWYVNPTSGAIVFLTYLQKDAFDQMFPSSVAYSTGGPYAIPGTDTSLILGDPTHYSLWNRKIILGKVPNRIITIFRDYYELPADLSGDSDTNQFTEEADQYIIFKSLVESSAYGIEDERMPMWAALAAKLEGNLDSEDSRRHVTGTRSQSREPG